MKNNTILSFVLILSFLSYINTTAQEDSEIDPSNPTNLYTQFNALAEFNANDGYNTYGTRFNFQYAFNANNLVLAEVPFLYNDATNKFGISDVRVRYFNVAKKNLSKNVIALVPFLDITIPTGDSLNGLGSHTWSLAAGAVIGVVINKNISLFPGINYVYITRPEISGLGFQSNISYKFSQKSFVFINPIVTLFKDDTIWQAELNFNHIITPNKFKVNAGWYPNFTNETNTFRIGSTFYF